VIAEASAVEARGRISPQDLGIWRDEHIEPLQRVTRFIHDQNSVPGIQLAHAGRKASTARPWDGGGPVDERAAAGAPWSAPVRFAFDEGYPVPEALDEAGIAQIVRAFADGARRAREAGFQIVELHAAHGYLLHQFLSPLCNRRTDRYGGDFAGRTRLLKETVAAVRQVWPEGLPLFVRLSATDWVENGWDIEQSVALARELKPLGVDLVDCSSGGAVPRASIPVAPGYQSALAARIRREANIATGAVGLITEPRHADTLVRDGEADLVLIGRELLRDPHWPQRAAHFLDHAVPTPVQYARAWPSANL
jgi:2,4-dienoyl-CoA reductase-like NADH-dependent reductase (Old Yellow Enzyme family)